MNTPAQSNQQNTPIPEPSVLSSPTPQQLSPNTKWYVLGLVVVLILVGGLLLLSQKSANAPVSVQPTVYQQPSIKPTVAPTQPRSNAPGVITHVVTSTSIDPKTGAALAPVTTFLPTDKAIYAVVTVNKPPVGTRIEYNRYLNNKYLDRRSVVIVKANTTSVLFDWTLKTQTATRLKGIYRVKFYTNGIFEKELSFTVQ